MRRTISKVRGLVAWVRSRPKRVTLPVAFSILALLAFGGFKAMDGYSYMQNNPNFCRACHTMEKAWDRWETSEHRSVNCHDCHQATLIEDTMLLIKFSLSRPDDVDKHAVVRDEACKKCHESGNPRWVQVADTVGHKVHAEEENIACVKCHGVSVHRFTPPGTICVLCHEEKHIAVSGMAEFHCDTCHEYMASSVASGEHELLPTRKECLSCHLALTELGVTWPAGAPMQFPCADCHKPHEQAAPTVNCLSCHLGVPSQGLHAGAVHIASECQTCHQPHQWETVARDTCLVCHSDRGQHNEGTACATCHTFTGPPHTSTPLDAASTPEPTASPAGSGEPSGPPPVPHSLEGRSECLTCHGAGAFKPFPEDHAGRASGSCLACHKQQ